MPETTDYSSPPPPATTVDAASGGAGSDAVRVCWPHLFLGAVGFALSLYAFRDSMGFQEQMRVYGAVTSDSCGMVSNSFNCGAVMTSPYGHPFGIPLGIFGMVYFMIVMVTGVTTSVRTTLSEAALWRLLVTTAGFIGSVIYTYISLKIIGRECLVCLSIHATNLILFVVSLIGYLKARSLMAAGRADPPA